MKFSTWVYYLYLGMKYTPGNEINTELHFVPGHEIWRLYMKLGAYI
jgi:hypothetical protein